MNKREIKRAYNAGDIGLSDAIPTLMFDCGMDHGAAVDFLMTSRKKPEPEDRASLAGDGEEEL